MIKKYRTTAAAFTLIAALLLPSCAGGGDVTTGAETEPVTVTGTEEPTETEKLTETETETEAAPELPYDDTHAYLFASSDKKTGWVTQGADVSVEFNVLKMVPTNHDPMIYCSFDESERFDSQEYPFVAYRYSVKTYYTQGVFFVGSEAHPQFSDSGLTWIDLDNSGEWTDLIADMRGNAFWEGTITAFRIDPLNGGTLDGKAVIYLDRVGFFKTEEDARDFLSAASEPDYSQSVGFSKGFAKAVIPGGVLSKGYDSNRYLMTAEQAAEIKDGTAPLVALKKDGVTTAVPVCYVNSVGFISYLAEQEGEYVLYYPETAGDGEEAFVRARGIMDDKDISSAALTAKRGAEILDRLLLTGSAASEAKDGPLTASDAAEMIGAFLSRINVIPYTDPDRRVKDASGNANLAISSGIVENMTADTVSGKEYAGMMTRLIKAVLGQPVLRSNIRENGGITIGAWANFPFRVTDKTIKTFSECGLSLLVDLGGIERRDTIGEVLNSADKYGVKVLRYNYSPSNFKASKPDAIPSSDYEYYDHESYYGNLVYDEPGTEKYKSMAALTEYYNKELPGKLCYYNLLPMYANAAQLKYGASAAQIAYYDEDPDLYKKYVESYAQTVGGDYMCVDIYPYRSNSKAKTTYTGYLKNMDIFATACREYGRDFWLYIQSTDYDGGKWAPDYDDLRWQTYIGLSFGVKTFIHFVYAWGGYETFIKDGAPTDIYYAAQKANKEILAFSDEYARYKNAGAFTLNCDKSKFAYAQFDNQYKDFSPLKDISSSDPLLFGCFEENGGDGYAFTVVNMNNINTKKTGAAVSFSLDGKYTVSMWRAGEKVSLTPQNGVYSIELAPAEGVFVTLEK